ncbi:MAG: hypothetical protein QFB86_01635 [Patescibacteria group bacterium]|nr:hypothetical protein [Patescibacteria group bacterium]
MKRQWFTRSALAVAVLSTVLFAGLLRSAPAEAVNPTTMNFQGKVVNANGTNVTDGNYSFVFKLYSVSSAGTALWTETQASVTVTAGVFQVNLGSSCSFFIAAACNNNTPIDFSTASTLYLGMTFNADAAGEMSPRVQLQSVPYAYYADNSGKLGGLTASQFIQLSPSGQQSGYINLSGNATFGGNLSVTGTLNTNTFNGTALTFGGAGAAAIQSASGQALNLTGNAASTLSTSAGNLTLQAGSGTVSLGSSTNLTATAGLSIASGGATALALDTGGAAVINVGTTNANAINLNQNTTIASGKSLTVTSGRTLITGAPTAGATSSLTQIGGPLAAGDASVNGGTYLSVASPSSGAGSVADFVSFENAGVRRFQIKSTGSIYATGSLTGGFLTDSRVSTNGATYTVSASELGYFLTDNSGTTNAAYNSIFNLTGLPALDGTVVFITASSVKGITNTARVHTLIVQIAGVSVATVDTASVATANTNTRSFILMRSNGTWVVSGTGLTAAPANATSTVNTADFAEWVHYSDAQQPQPGDILTVGDIDNSVKRSSGAYDNNIVGVVSTEPYQVASADDGHSVIIGLSGRVPVKVNLENGPIYLGDKLVASSTPGEAMKAIRAGRILGTALSSYDGSQSSASVTVQLGVSYDSPSSNSSVVSATAIAGGALSLDTSTSLLQEVSLDSPPPATTLLTSSNPAALEVEGQANMSTIAAATEIAHSSVATQPTPSVDPSTPANDKPTAVSATVPSITIVDTTGVYAIRFDATGTAALPGDLNLASAKLSGGLSMAGDLQVGGLSTFQKLATFIGKVVFRQDVQFDKHIAVAKDTAGYASIRPGESVVHVAFHDEYETTPVVNANSINGSFAEYTIDHITTKGFDISLKAPADTNIKLSWIALSALDPQTAENPQAVAP